MRHLKELINVLGNLLTGSDKRGQVLRVSRSHLGAVGSAINENSRAEWVIAASNGQVRPGINVAIDMDNTVNLFLDSFASIISIGCINTALSDFLSVFGSKKVGALTNGIVDSKSLREGTVSVIVASLVVAELQRGNC